MPCSKSFTNAEIKVRIKNIWTKFVSAVEPDRLSDWLVQENVITTDQWQRIHTENPTKESRCRGLLYHLFSIPHPRAFLVVRQALVADNHYLLESIDNQEPRSRSLSLPDIHSALQASEFFTNDEIKGRIQNICAKFVLGVDPDRLSDWLVQENVITSDQWQMIHSENPTRVSRCRALLHHLNSIPNPRAFLVVRQALAAETHYLLEFIDNQEPESRISLLSEIQSASQAVLHGEAVKDEVIQIVVDAWGKTHFVTLHRNAQVDELFRVVSEQFAMGVKPEKLRLILGDVELKYDEGKTLQDYKMCHLYSVTLLLRLGW